MLLLVFPFFRRRLFVCANVVRCFVAARYLLRTGKACYGRDVLSLLQKFLQSKDLPISNGDLNGGELEAGILFDDREVKEYFQACVCRKLSLWRFLRFFYYLDFMRYGVDQCLGLIDIENFDGAERCVNALHALPSAVLSKDWDKEDYWVFYIAPNIELIGDDVLAHKKAFLSSVWFWLAARRMFIRIRFVR